MLVGSGVCGLGDGWFVQVKGLISPQLDKPGRTEQVLVMLTGDLSLVIKQVIELIEDGFRNF